MKKIGLKILGILTVAVILLQTMSIAATQNELESQKNDNEKKMDEAQAELDDVKEEKYRRCEQKKHHDLYRDYIPSVV